MPEFTSKPWVVGYVQNSDLKGDKGDKGDTGSQGIQG